MGKKSSLLALSNLIGVFLIIAIIPYIASFLILFGSIIILVFGGIATIAVFFYMLMTMSYIVAILLPYILPIILVVSFFGQLPIF